MKILEILVCKFVAPDDKVYVGYIWITWIKIKLLNNLSCQSVDLRDGAFSVQTLASAKVHRDRNPRPLNESTCKTDKSKIACGHLWRPSSLSSQTKADF